MLILVHLLLRERQSKSRAQHNIVSQRGREKIVEQIMQLKALLPECNSSDVALSKAEILQCALRAIEREQLSIQLYSHEIAVELAQNEVLRQQYEQAREAGFFSAPPLPPPMFLLDSQWHQDEDPLMSPSDGGLGADYSWSSASEATFEVLDSGQTSPEGIYSTPSHSNPFLQSQSPQFQPQYNGNLSQYNSEQPQYSPALDASTIYASYPTISQQFEVFKRLEKLQPKNFKQVEKSISTQDKRPTKKRRLENESSLDVNNAKQKAKKEPTPQLTLLQFDQDFEGPIIQNLSTDPPARMFTDIILTENTDTLSESALPLFKITPVQKPQ